MNIHFNILTIQCRQSREVLDLTSQITFFHGKISSGKSSIARLIDFCLGGTLEETPAIRKEFITATLDLNINGNHVLLERALNTNQVQCTWVDMKNETAVVLAPVTPGLKAIYSTNIFSLSDLIFYLSGIDPIKIPSNQNLADATLTRLSFRNVMWYCYLDQNHLDSSFYKLEDPMRKRNSRGVLRYMMQFSSDKLNKLEADLITTKEEKAAKTVSVTELTAFLKKVGFNSAADIEMQQKKASQGLQEVKQKRTSLEKEYKGQTHSSDKTRKLILGVRKEMLEVEDSIKALQTRISEQTSLKAELISSKFKLARTESVTSVLSGVAFNNCPSCGTDISKRPAEPEKCPLCTSRLGQVTEALISDNSEIIRLDLDTRIKDIEDSLQIHKSALSRQRRQLTILENKKMELDNQLTSELKNYESAYLSNIRSVDRDIATFQERIKGLSRLKEFPAEITNLENRIIELGKLEERIKKDIIKEKGELKRAEELIKDLEATFLDTLVTVGIPGVNETDTVLINRTTWEPVVGNANDPDSLWNFHNAGSGGKKTLFNVCFLVSLHIVAERNNLTLPNFMIIDTPMKNIDKEVNEDIFKRFYDYVYRLSEGELDNTQMIIIDNSFIPPANQELGIKARYMTPDDHANPPLISYYRGN